MYTIKESFDQNLESYYTSSVYDYNNDATLWWQSWGWNLLSYLKMYEATHDKAYLNKFVKHSYNIQMRRNTFLWDMDGTSSTIVLYTGQLLRPMAEFVYIVNQDNTLYNTNILQGVVQSTLSDPTQTVLGYGDYANWLQKRITRTMDYLLAIYWSNDNNCFNKGGAHVPIEINFNAPYASTMFYIGNVDPYFHSDYTHKAEQIVIFFRNRVTEYVPNHSYTWFHDDFDPFREDVSHGAIDIQIPIVAYQLYGNGLYQPSEMNKFAHTFSKNIWRGNNSFDVFHNNVFGLDYDIADGDKLNSCNYAANGTQNYYGPGEVLAWAPLYQFDSNVYDILINQATKLLDDYNGITALVPANYCLTTTRYLSGAQPFYGLSEVVKAQWDRECVNLTLFNRDLVYDQDFNVKNIFTIAPQENFVQSNITYYTAGTDDPFAEPKTFTDNGSKDRFVIEPNVTSTITAGEEIILRPGFTAKYGSTFTASLGASCQETNGGNRSFAGNNSNSNSLPAQTLPINPIQNKLIVIPNPSSGKFSVSFANGQSTTGYLQVMDLIGNVIYQSLAQNSKADIDLSAQPKGIYFIKLQSGDKIYTDKIIIQ